MTVRRIMSSNVVYLTPDDTVSRAAKLMARHNIGILPVCSKDGRLRGIVTDRDIALRCVAFGNPAEETTLREIMTRGSVTVSPEDDVMRAAEIMAREKVRRLPVLENGKLSGMLSLSDIALRESLKSEVAKTFADISHPPKRFGLM